MRERLRKCDLNGLEGGDGNLMLLTLILLVDDLENSHCVTGENLVSGRGGVVVAVDAVEAVDLVVVAGASGGNDGEGIFSSRGSAKGTDLSCRILRSQPAIFEEASRPGSPIAYPGMDAERDVFPPAEFNCETLAKCGINGQAVPAGGVNDGCCT